MQYRMLGRTGLRVSEIGFGCWAIGGPFEVGGRPIGWGHVDDRQSHAAILRALDLGINFFDTADIYGLGHSEEVLGEALRGRRAAALVASKVGNVKAGDGTGRKDFSASHIAASCESSLRRLKTDCIDLYQLHNPPLPELWLEDAGEAMARLQKEGKIRHFGVSISHPREGFEIVRRGFGSALQVLFNVFNQKAADGLFNLAQRSGFGIIARVPLASALLSGKIQSPDFDPQDNRRNFLTPRRLAELKPKVERYLDLCRHHGTQPVAGALGFILQHSTVSTAIPGAKTEKQVTENAAASGNALPQPLLQALHAEFHGYNFYLRYGVDV